MDVENTVFSPDSKLMAGCLAGGEGDPNGVFLLDPATGRLLNTFADAKHRANPPYFFLSNTRLVYGNVILNIKTGHTAPLLRPRDTRLRCVSGVPGALGYAFFQTKTGLELWDLPAQRPVRRWASVTKADHLYFAADHSVMGVLSGTTLTFWPFDARTLKTAGAKAGK